MLNRILIIFTTFFLIIGCGPENLNGVDEKRPLIKPKANAGDDLYIRTGESVTLDAKESNDSDGKIIAYEWDEENETLSTGELLKDYITDIPGTHTITLTVTDNDGLQDSDTVKLFVTEQNIPPTANAGDDQHIRFSEKVTLNGSGSIDKDGKIISYSWEEEGEVLSTGEYLKEYSTLVEGIHPITLTVTDNEGLDDTDTVYIFVVDNKMPIANAGNDQSIRTGEKITLDGNKSNDLDGVIVQYEWVEDNRTLSTGVQLINYETNESGIHTITLTVTDNDGFQNSDTVDLNVTQANVPPIANAGNDKINIHVGDKVTLDGSDSNDSDGKIVAYTWKENNTTLSTGVQLIDYSPVSEGVHIIELTVTDNEGLEDTDSVYISVLANEVPLANAGNDQTIRIGEKVTLSASASYDSDGEIVSYIWKEGSKVLSTSMQLIDYMPSTAGTHTLDLTVTDNDGFSSSDSVYVHVTDNTPPLANAGNDQSIRVGESITLDGSRSFDSDGSIVRYEWKEGSTVLSTGVNLTNYSSSTVGTHTIVLTVTDNEGAINSDSVNVVVTAANVAPVANAGPDKTINVGDKVTLDGSSSYDTDGSIVRYEWKEGSTVLSTGAKLIDYSSAASGVHVIELTVTDNDGATHTDSVYIIVNDDGNTPPLANAGNDQSIRVGESITLDGSRSFDSDGSIVRYEWKEGSTVLSTGVNLTNYSSSTVGTHTIVLTVTDNEGAINSDSVNVVVTAANVAPVANAGPDKTINVGDKVTLDGSSSYDTDGSIVRYEWKEGSTVLSTGAKLIDYSSAASGVHVIELTVTDNDGATHTDSVYIIVNDDGNTPPLANAGNDQSIRVGESITLDGSRSFDSDGSIVRYEWKEGSTVLSTGVNLTNYSSSTVGTHTIVLTVTDNEGAINSDSVNVVVTAANVAPVANAGPDKTINVGDKVTLDGSSSYDTDGSIVRYEWKEGSTVLSTGAKLIDYSSAASGVHVIELTVTDNDGATHTDSVYVTIN